MFIDTHKIAGITFQTKSDIRLPYLLDDRFQQFSVSGTMTDVYHRYSSVDIDSLTLPPLSTNEVKSLSRCILYPKKKLDNALLRSTTVRPRLLDCLNYPSHVAFELRDSSLTIFDFVQRKIDIFYAPNMRDVLSNGFFGPLMFTTFLSIFSAAMIHSSALILNDVAALFLAPDEGGKTTAVKLSKAGDILCDDQIVLRKENGAFTAFGTPWGLITNSHKRARVGGFFLLGKSDHFELISLSPLYGLRYLWNEHLGYFLFLPKYFRLLAFEILYEACHKVPVYLMRFPKDYVDWNAVEAAMLR